jgi:hypothetical protein
MRARLVLVPIAITAALLAGCGKDKTPAAAPPPTNNGVAALSATEILDKAKAAAIAAGSVHVKGSTSSENQNISIDLKIDHKDFAGTIETSGTVLEIIRLGSDFYLKAPDAFWEQMIPKEQQVALALIKGKYVKMGSDNPSFKELSSIGDFDTLLKPEGTVSKGQEKTVNGTPAIALVDSTDKGSLYIATVGQPLPVRIESAKNEGIDFTEWGTSFGLKAPPATEVFDLSKLLGGGG